MSSNTSAPRRGRAPFIAAAALAVVLIVVLRLLFGGGDDGNSGESAGAARKAATCGSDGVRLTVLSSPEKGGLMREFAAGYTGRRVAGRCAEVVITEKTSGDGMAALAGGWNARRDRSDRPDVWSPAASAWVTLLRQRTLDTDRGQIVPDGAPPSLASSPVVIAMPRPMAEALGWPKKKLGWADILRLADDPKGWAAAGHPEWGQFRLGKTNPNFSTSGLNATIAAYFAATGRSSDLSERDLRDPKVKDFIRRVERSIVHYGDNSLAFLTNLRRADDAGTGLSYISAVTLEEQSVWAYNEGYPTGAPQAGAKRARPRTPLVAIYPKEGTLGSDHPYVPLTWMDPAKRRVADDFLAYLRSAQVQRRLQANGFRDFRDRAGGLATPANGLLADQPGTKLTPPAPAVLDKVLQSWSSLRKPANVLLVMDVSGSMGANAPGTGKTKLELAQEAATNSLGQFADRDRVGLWMFSTHLEGNNDWRELVPIGPMNGSVEGSGTRRTVMRDRIDGMIADGGTGLYDTTLSAYQTVKNDLRPDSINAVVVMTDGNNEDDGIDLDTLVGSLRTEGASNPVRVFTLSYGADADQKALGRIAETTNAAQYDSSDPANIDRVFTAVISNF